MCGKHLAAFLVTPPQHRGIPGRLTGGPARLVDKLPAALQCPVRPESFVHNNSATAISSMIEGTPPATLSTDVQSGEVVTTIFAFAMSGAYEPPVTAKPG